MAALAALYLTLHSVTDSADAWPGINALMETAKRAAMPRLRSVFDIFSSLYGAARKADYGVAKDSLPLCAILIFGNDV